jgi:hypothetical protein
MFERLLVALDESVDAEAVLRVACALANRCHADLTVISIAEPAAVAVGGEEASGLAADPAAITRITRCVHGSVDRHQSPEMELGSSLGSWLDGIGPSLIVMTSPRQLERPDSGATRIRDVLQSTGRPVLLLPAGQAGQLLGSSGRPPRFLVVLRDASSDEAMLDSVVSLSQAVGAHLTLLSVAAPNDSDPPATGTGGLVATMQHRLDRIAAGLRDRGQSVATIVETTTDPGGAIVDQLEHGDYDLVTVTCNRLGAEDDVSDMAEAIGEVCLTPLLLLRGAYDPDGLGEPADRRAGGRRRGDVLAGTKLDQVAPGWTASAERIDAETDRSSCSVLPRAPRSTISER